MIKRLAEFPIRKLADQFPAVLILGPRQCGKTTLAKSILRARYVDLEMNSDRQVFEGDPELALRRIQGPIVFDEAQTMPELFPTLRALIDEQRDCTGRYYLLGSVNPDLIRGVSESLAGRVGILDLTPLLFAEVREAGLRAMDTLWLRGGYPQAFLAGDPDGWNTWFENYVRTFVERDVPRSGLAFSPPEMRRFVTMLAHGHSGLLNASDVGRSLGISYHTVQRGIDLLEGHFLVRRLTPYHANVGKRLVKAPKIYLRDSGLLHFLLGIRSEEELLFSAARGRSWEGFAMEQLMAVEQLRRPGCRFHFYRTHTGVEIDLLVEAGSKRTGYEFKCAASVSSEDHANLRQGLADGIIHEGRVVYPGDKTFPVSESISVVAAAEALAP